MGIEYIALELDLVPNGLVVEQPVGRNRNTMAVLQIHDGYHETMIPVYVMAELVQRGVNKFILDFTNRERDLQATVNIILGHFSGYAIQHMLVPFRYVVPREVVVPNICDLRARAAGTVDEAVERFEQTF